MRHMSINEKYLSEYRMYGGFPHALNRRFPSPQFLPSSQRVSAHLDALGVMNEPVKDAIG
jgi:hypothetical protein